MGFAPVDLRKPLFPFSDASLKRVTDCCVEIFLPSYANFDFDDLERKQDPVQEIVVTDEEIAKMFPS